ncbi:lysozyme [Capnocytophaga haemolytica]|uniref:Glycoside hydrolase n=1 Tax=Capnocytophaga haemolytica TaxID=45243 RepID=A0AAX2H0Z1_9FLAO|nr:GH25 family lysozyme [Capnocytophaga haemolytica]AMD85669.1 glycoside hydrolase [Capnocytophaga haemolytica]SFN90335.1 lysozyme [Capnocytophaga haemolytica]SNV16470.1 Lysozyme M1 precursor [Capnocytophaga haemolytica]
MRRKSSKQRRSAHKGGSHWKSFLWGFFLCIFVVGVGGALYIRTYYPAMYQKILNKISSRKINTTYESQRIERIVSLHSDKILGIDLSHYQDKGEIIWDSLHIKVNEHKYPLQFAVFRATMGNDGSDKNFTYFWKEAKQHTLIRGAYHYYRPDEDPELQARSYLKNAQLEKGDLPPILDVEKLPKKKSTEAFLADIQKWLDIVEQKYKRKPIIYTYISFYEDYLSQKFKKYPFWVANYNNVEVPTTIFKWQMWQFTENGISPGAKVKIDLNIYNGSYEEMEAILIK